MADSAGKKTDSLIKSTSSYLTLFSPEGHLFKWLLPLLGASVAGFAASASNFLKPFGYLGWISAALFGAVLTAVLALIIEQIRFVRAKRLYPELYASADLDDRSNWAKGLSVMSICDMACAIAGVLPREFEKSGRAKAIAIEIQSRVNDGWVPIDNETSERTGAMVIEVIGRPNFDKKSVDLLQPLYVKDVERFCSHQNWNFSWAHEAALPKGRGTIELKLQ